VRARERERERAREKDWDNTIGSDLYSRRQDKEEQSFLFSRPHFDGYFNISVFSFFEFKKILLSFIIEMERCSLKKCKMSQIVYFLRDLMEFPRSKNVLFKSYK